MSIYQLGGGCGCCNPPPSNTYWCTAVTGTMHFCSVCTSCPLTVTFPVAIGGSTTWTLTPGGLGWSVVIAAPGSDPYLTSGLGSPSEPWSYVILEVVCSSSPGVVIAAYSGYGATATGPWYGSGSGVQPGNPVVTACDPFTMSLGTSSNQYLNGLWFWLYDLGAEGNYCISVTQSSSYYSPAGCYPPFTVLGCFTGLRQPVAGAAVGVWSGPGGTGTNYGSGTTNSSGQVTVATSVVNIDNFYYSVSAARFQTVNGQQDGVNPSDPITVNLTTVASGYHCLTSGSCGYPLPATLHATHSVFGAVTMAYNASGSLGAGWYGTVSYSYPGCYCCAAATVTVTCYLSTAGNYSDNWSSS